MPETFLILLGMVLVMLGLFILVFLGITQSVQGSINGEKNTDVKAGSVIMIGQKWRKK